MKPDHITDIPSSLSIALKRGHLVTFKSVTSTEPVCYYVGLDTKYYGYGKSVDEACRHALRRSEQAKPELYGSK